jgi:hypothetical protein
MRIKNKEIARRRHRKEQKIKDAARELRAKFGEDKPGGVGNATVKKAAPKKAKKAE